MCVCACVCVCARVCVCVCVCARAHGYSMAEALKDGHFVSTEFEVKFKVPKRSHVIFFGNSMPEEGKWSRDRVILVVLDKPDFNHSRVYVHEGERLRG